MSKELIERLRLMSADTYGNDAADALESLEAAYSGAVEAGKALAKQALKAERDRDALAAELKAVRGDQTPATDDINLQEWKGMDGACAWHLIDRYAEDWHHTARLMNAWLEANREELVAELKALGDYANQCLREFLAIGEVVTDYMPDPRGIQLIDGIRTMELLIDAQHAQLVEQSRQITSLTAELKSLREQEPPADIDPHDAMLQKQHDEAQGPLANAAHKVYFRAGLLACREHMARFVESQDPSIAASIRANWWPDLGPDMGPPRRIEWGELTEGEYGESGFRVKEPHEISPTIEALPIAQHFLTPDEGTTK